ncbi:MAG: LamG domain-containing protein [Williamsia sp.]|nr:LamG domain-containing protein [Williamsia sp.]
MRFFLHPVWLVLLLALALLTTCKKNEAPPDYNSDKSKLKALIDSVTLVYNAAVEGTKPGNYAIGSKQPLKASIDLALQINTGTMFTQEAVDNALSNLRRSAQEFASRLIQEVSLENLLAQWKMDGNATDASGHGHTGQLKTGWTGKDAATAVDGATLPVGTPDRFNRPNMAYRFEKGANIEVPYDASLNPQSFTISVWLRRDSIRDGNYILSLNRWEGFKFQLQTNNFMFLTFKVSNTVYKDVDSNPGVIPQSVWTHAAVSYTEGAMKFYINGVLVKSVNISGTPITLPSPVNLVIGNQLPKSVYMLTSGDFQYGGENFFIGSMDDLRFYNKALTDAEVLSIFTIERSL